MSQRAESFMYARPASGGRQSPSKGMTAADKHISAADKHISAASSSRYSSICDSGLGSIGSTGTESLRRSSAVDDIEYQLNDRLQSACSVARSDYGSGSIDAEQFTLSTQYASPTATAAAVAPSDFSPDADGDTPLHIAVILGMSIQVSLLLRGGALSRQQVNSRNDLQQTALHLAVGTKQPAVVKDLLTAGADVMARDWRGNTPAHLACRDGDAECLDALVDALTAASSSGSSSPRSSWQPQRLPLDVHNYDGLAPLHLAAAGRHLGLVRRLIESRLADVNYQEAKAGRTLLHLAAESDDVALARLALELGGEPDVCSYSGARPAAVAKAWRHANVGALLRECEGDVALSSGSSRSSSGAEGDAGSSDSDDEVSEERARPCVAPRYVMSDRQAATAPPKKSHGCPAREENCPGRSVAYSSPDLNSLASAALGTQKRLSSDVPS